MTRLDFGRAGLNCKQPRRRLVPSIHRKTHAQAPTHVPSCHRLSRDCRPVGTETRCSDPGAVATCRPPVTVLGWIRVFLASGGTGFPGTFLDQLQSRHGIRDSFSCPRRSRRLQTTMGSPENNNDIRVKERALSVTSCNRRIFLRASCWRFNPCESAGRQAGCAP